MQQVFGPSASSAALYGGGGKLYQYSEVRSGAKYWYNCLPPRLQKLQAVDTSSGLTASNLHKHEQIVKPEYVSYQPAPAPSMYSGPTVIMPQESKGLIPPPPPPSLTTDTQQPPLPPRPVCQYVFSFNALFSTLHSQPNGQVL